MPGDTPPEPLREEAQPYVAGASPAQLDDPAESAGEFAADSGNSPATFQKATFDNPRTPLRREQEESQGGASAGNGFSGEEPAPTNGSTTTPAFDGDGPAFHLQITLKRSEDEEADIQRIGKVYDVLTQYEGHDRFSLVVIHPPAGADDRTGAGVKLDFPNDTTRYCVRLLENLEDIVGRGAVQVQPAANG